MNEKQTKPFLDIQECFAKNMADVTKVCDVLLASGGLTRSMIKEIQYKHTETAQACELNRLRYKRTETAQACELNRLMQDDYTSTDQFREFLRRVTKRPDHRTFNNLHAAWKMIRDSGRTEQLVSCLLTAVPTDQGVIDAGAIADQVIGGSRKKPTKRKSALESTIAGSSRESPKKPKSIPESTSLLSPIEGGMSNEQKKCLCEDHNNVGSNLVDVKAACDHLLSSSVLTHMVDEILQDIERARDLILLMSKPDCDAYDYEDLLVRKVLHQDVLQTEDGPAVESIGGGARENPGGALAMVNPEQSPQIEQSIPAVKELSKDGMSNGQKKCLWEHHNYVVSNLVDVKTLCDHLLSFNVLTQNMVEEIMAEKKTKDRARVLHTLILKRPASAFKHYYDALNESGNEDLAELLKPWLPLDLLTIRSPTEGHDSDDKDGVARDMSGTPLTTVLLPSQQRQHIMISYQRASKHILKDVRDALQKRGYNVWMNDMKADTHEAIPDVVQNSSVVLVAGSDEYVKNATCKKEARYAKQIGKKIIRLTTEPNCVPREGGTDYITRSYIKFTKAIAFKESFGKLLRKLEDLKVERFYKKIEN